MFALRCLAASFSILLAVPAGGAAETPSAAYSIVASIPGPDGGWDLLDVDSGRRRLYVARRDAVMAIDLATGKVTPELIKSSRGHGVLSIPGSTQVISTNGDAGTAALFDGVTGAVTATLTVGTKPDAIAFDPATKTVWIMNAGSGDISVVDPFAATVVATVAVGGALELAAADGEGRLYVNVEDKNEVVAIDTRAKKVVAHFPLQGCDGPTGIAYAPDLKLILSACANGIAKITTSQGGDVATLTVGPRPDGAVYDAQRHVAFVPSGGDGTLSVIRFSPEPQVVQRIATAKGARTAALDHATGRIYIPSAQLLPPAGDARPAAVPGTFAIMVVAPDAATP